MSPRWRSAGSLLLAVLVVSGASEGWRAWSDARLGATLAARARPGDIVMIASDTCVYCDRARAWFNAHGVPVSECRIEHDEACAARFRALGAPGTPMLLVRGRPQLGFDPQRLADALAPA